MIITGRPISKKNNHVGSNNRFFVTSAAYKRWENDAIRQLKGQEKFAGPIFVTLNFMMKGKIDADVDNLATSVIDVLQKAGIIDNDRNILSLTANKHRGFSDWSTEIRIFPVKGTV